MERTGFGAVARRARWAVLALVVVGALGGLLLDVRLDRLPDSSTAQLTVADATGAPPSSDEASTAKEYISHQVPTYAQLATSDDVLGPAAAAAGTTVEAMRPEVTATAPDESTTLDIVVRGATPQAATDEANALIRSLTDSILRLEARPGQTPRVAVNVVSPPSVPATRFVPPVGALTAAGAVAGLLVALLGVAIAASGRPQRLGRTFWAWLVHHPSEAELAKTRDAEDPRTPRDDPEAALAKAAGRWLSNRRNQD
jgi:capsular polysaccharide biosynthesis protein